MKEGQSGSFAGEEAPAGGADGVERATVAVMTEETVRTRIPRASTFYKMVKEEKEMC